MSWLDDLLGPVVAFESGVEKTTAHEWNFIGFTVAYNSATGQLDITATPGIGGQSKFLYVDKAGNDATAIRGRLAYPYLTIQTALDAMQSGDAVVIGPGTWSETLILPELAVITILGSGVNATTITSAAATATLGADPSTTKLQSLTIADLTVLNTGAGQAIALTGASLASPGLFISGILDIHHVATPGDGVVVTCAGHVRISDCLFGSLDCNEVDDGLIDSCSVSGIANASWGHTATLPAGVGGSHKVTFRHCEVATLTPKNVAQVDAWDMNVTTATTTSFSENGAAYGKLRATGYLGRVTVEADSVAAVSSAVLDGAHMTSLTVSSTAGALRAGVSARNASVDGTITANTLCDIDARGSTYTALASAGTGTIDRSTHTETFAAIIGDTAIAFTVPFPTGATYVPTFSMVGAGGDPFAKNITVAGFDVTCAAALGAGNKAVITRT